MANSSGWRAPEAFAGAVARYRHTDVEALKAGAGFGATRGGDLGAVVRERPSRERVAGLEVLGAGGELYTLRLNASDKWAVERVRPPGGSVIPPGGAVNIHVTDPATGRELGPEIWRPAAAYAGMRATLTSGEERVELGEADREHLYWSPGPHRARVCMLRLVDRLTGEVTEISRRPTRKRRLEDAAEYGPVDNRGAWEILRTDKRYTPPGTIEISCFLYTPLH